MKTIMTIENTTDIRLSPQRLDISPSLDLFWRGFIEVPQPYQFSRDRCFEQLGAFSEHRS